LEFKGATLAGFADILSRFMDCPVLDRTGLPGAFDITLNVSMEDLAGLRLQLGAPRQDAEAAGVVNPAASIFSAIRALGLRLDATHASIRCVVVDEAEKSPTGN
jgi:uncharacterized protein (TIGR03435 family)